VFVSEACGFQGGGGATRGGHNARADRGGVVDTHELTKL
jgi:hypothetical protein